MTLLGVAMLAGVFGFLTGWWSVRVKDALEAKHHRWRYRRSKPS